MPKTLIEVMEEFRKSGSFSPEAVNVGGQMRPEESDKFIDLVIKSVPFFQRVTVDRTKKLSKDINVWELMRKVLQRVPQGSAAEDYTAFGNAGGTLEMKDAQLFSNIPFDFLRDNQHRAGFENLVTARLTEAYGNDVLLLAFTGTNDNFHYQTNKVFESLNKGWPQLIKESASAHKIKLSDHTGGTPAVVNWDSLLGDMLQSLPSIYKSDKVAFLVNRSDAELYQRQIGQMMGGLGHLLDKKTLNYLGYEIVAINELPQGNVILTPLPNLIYGVNTQMERYRELKGEERCIRYTYDSSFDFQVAIPSAAVIAYDF